MPLISTDLSDSTFHRLRRGQLRGDLADLPADLQRKVRAQLGVNAESLLSRQYNPFIQRLSIEEPRSWEERVRWKRYFYQTDPVVHAAIDVHAQRPLSNLHIMHEDPEIREFFEDLIDEINLFEFLVDLNTELLVVGEVLPFGFFDHPNNPGCWTGFILINPVNTTIEGHEVIQGNHKETIILKLDPKLKRILENQADPVLGPLAAQVPPDMAEAVRTGQGLKLNALQVSRIREPGSYHSRRSSSMIDSIFRDLMYRDKLRQAQFAVADRHIGPKEFYFLGSDEQPASDEELNKFREAIAAGWTDVNQAVVYHHAVRVQIEGASGKVLPIWPEMEQIDKKLMVGLRITEGVLTGDTGAFATNVVSYNNMIETWISQRQRLEKWIRRSVFGPLCKLHEMYVPEHKVKSNRYRRDAGLPRPLWIPDVRWEKQHLRDESARLELLTGLAAQKLIPIDMVLDLLEIDRETVEDEVDRQIERQAKRKKKLVERLQKMGLLAYAEFGPTVEGAGGGGPLLSPAAGGEFPSVDLGGGGPVAGGPPLPEVVPGAEPGAPSGAVNPAELPGGPGGALPTAPAAGGGGHGANAIL